MGKGKNVPSGVAYYGFEPAGTKKGKNHPSKVKGAEKTVESYGGAPSGVEVGAGATSTTVPAGVVQHDGTNDRGSAPVHKQATAGAPGSGSGKAQPSGVRTFSGLSAPAPKRKGA